MDMYNKVLLYTAVLRPIISYGCPVWGYAAKTNVKILETAQNSIIRTITKANRYTRNSNIYKALKLPPFKNQPRGNSPSSTDQSQCLCAFHTSSQKTSLVSSSDFCVTLLLLPATTSVTTIFQPANQVASCSPSRTLPLPQATLTVLLWDGGTLRVLCLNK
ncbi:hypothetical protein TNCV_167891 [Trichonephila clavipes]|nr:hypothetical protein TNCV_167891 [Trichonephila clavipes]